jgi:HK97 family phage portal protein
MNMLTQSIQSALETIKSIPTVFRVPDQQFAKGGGRVARILGGTDNIGDNAQIYANSIWVYAAINTIARNISQVPFVFQREGEPLKSDTPMTRLFEKPNEWQGYGQFMEALVSWLHVNGEVVIILNRKSDKELPTEMVVMDSTDFEPVLRENGTLAGWKFTNAQGKVIPMRKHQVMFMRFWNPLDPIRGLSPINAARSGITQDAMANTFNTNFFANSGAPSGVIEIEQNLTDQEFERVVKQYEDNHGGPSKAHKMLILEGGAKFKPTVFTQRDMEFLSQKKWNRDETLAAFGVPKSEVGISEEGANLAIVKIQAREFWLKNLIPKMELIAWHFWTEMFSKINGGRVWAEFNTSAIAALQAEFDEKVKTARSLWEVGYPMNQLNKRLDLGLPENSWQNTAYQPLQVQPVAVDKDGTPIVQDTTNPGADPLQAPSTGEDTKPNEGEEVEPKPAQEVSPSEKPRAAVADPSKAAIGLLTKKLQRFFYRQRVRQIKSFKKNRGGLLDAVTEVTALKSYLNDRGVETDCKDLQMLVSTKMAVLAIKNFDSTDKLLEEVKEVYNKIDKAIPEMAVTLYEK